MKHRVLGNPGFVVILGLILLLSAKNNWATIHVVQFGGNLGYVYSPKTFSASVGDTVQWDGDFSMHPLSSTTIPAGAAAWHNTTGTSFQYVITVPGTYNYQCDVHYSLGMVGSFVASAAAVRQERLSANSTHVMFLDVTTPGKLSVSFFVPYAEFVTLEVFDLLGHKIVALVNQIEEAGNHNATIRTRISAHGLYFAKLSENGEVVIGALRDLNR